VTTGLATGVYAIARTKRRRFLWCAWWTAPPQREPFRAPDAWAGAATEEEARVAAERAAGRPLRLVESRWAGAWVRVRAGWTPWPERRPPPSDVASARPRPVAAHAVLGVAHDATLVEIKAAFRRLVLEHHPDHGGDPAALMRVKRAYDALLTRRRGPPPRQ